MRRSQLQTRQDEREEREREKESRKNEKGRVAEAAVAKKRGRPRKVEEPPAEPQVEERSQKRRTKTKEQRNEVDDPPKEVPEVDTKQRKRKGQDGAEPKAKGKAKKVKGQEDKNEVAEEPAEPVAKSKVRRKKAAPTQKDTEEEPEEPADDDEEVPAGPRVRRRRLRRLTEDVQEMDVCLSKECKELMDHEGENPEVDRDEIRYVLFANFMTNPSVRVVFYWDRNAVGLKVKAADGSFPQCFYFQVKGCTTIKVATILAKRMFDKIAMRGLEWAHSEQATTFEQVLKNSAFRARAEGAS